LSQGQEVGERFFVNPSPALHELAVKVSDVRCRSTETGEPEFQADGEDL
jgi:hypothetical protein